jgi:methionyl aminopeptidase
MTIKTKAEIDVLREGGKILANILEQVLEMIKPGITTLELEEVVNAEILKAGGRPAFKDLPMGNDLDFPTALCTSINNEIVHGPAIPARELKNGDIISVDVGMEWPFQGKYKRIVNPYSLGGGYYTDMAKTVAVGKVSKEAKQLMKVTQACLSAGINVARAGNTINDIGKAVEAIANKYSYGVVRDLVGHGVGHEVHEKPDVFNYEIGDNYPLNFKLEEGMVIAIEPMITLGTAQIKEGKDDFSYVTKDSKLSAHFEHSLAITNSEPLIITNL